MPDPDWLDGLEVEDPIVPDPSIRGNQEHSLISEGWKFYLSVKERIADLWQEFNGEMDKKKARLKYRTVKQFADSKFKSATHRKYFYWMICSRQEWENTAFSKRNSTKVHTVPWLGDWYKRRKNGYWVSNIPQVRELNKAINENVESTKAIKAAAPFLVQELMRYNRLQEQVDELFDGRVFNSSDPTSGKNLVRYKVYTEMLQKVTHLKIKLIKEWMRVHGVAPEHPHEMWDMATIAQLSGQAAAAGAVTGVAAGQFLLQNPGAAPTVLSRDTLLLADHLTSHKGNFKEVHDVVLDGDEVVGVKELRKEREKTNGKTNGKHVTQ